MPYWGPEHAVETPVLAQVRPGEALISAKVNDQLVKSPQLVPTIPTAMLAKAYQEGYTDGAAKSLSDPLMDLFEKDTAAIPVSLRSWAAEHPYTTLSSIGSAGTLAVVSSSFVTARLAKRFGPSTLSIPTPKSLMSGAMMRKNAADLEKNPTKHFEVKGVELSKQLRKEIQDMRREMMQFLPVIQQVEGMEGRISEQITKQVRTGMAEVSNELCSLEETVEPLLGCDAQEEFGKASILAGYIDTDVVFR